ncbi:hypothetical protein CK228_25485 [Mesorhizobium sp. WSM4312]|nr:hypothetical protein A4R28_21550 [Mesorhizobium ciceri]PBB17475.1 hypothetical protein CK219_23070 [Mesorhizobium sp. WSM4313]PBB23137.1 hypothetical protein CK232_29060 [Mesorhizobium sp. WSM4304]PBB46178.1 hypothetical protein CK213_28645 [Mesorhizobium loti]PBB65778.1 hypothetical protein CK228_25485 [Mesorhizobium sp. WSM4312]PBB71936.1 hypothetical protein CK227_29030 [Mesorhizobium sp. WSM4308]PBC19816.1 hypothetical protein CK226_27080 [Mesorhizobium sp. WSM4311]
MAPTLKLNMASYPSRLSAASSHRNASGRDQALNRPAKALAGEVDQPFQHRRIGHVADNSTGTRTGGQSLVQSLLRQVSQHQIRSTRRQQFGTGRAKRATRR